MAYEVNLSDCIDFLQLLEDSSIDALVTDPPSGINFMGQAWDDKSKYVARSEKGVALQKTALEILGLEAWEAGFLAFLVDVMLEVIRVLKPGAHGLVWALPRTSDLTTMALRVSGFEVRDVVTHHFASGFPKGIDLSKAIDKRLGAQREVVGIRPDAAKLNKSIQDAPGGWHTAQRDPTITVPATPEAERWKGWGSALKPATEFWILIRKPLAERTLIENVLVHGAGGINVDGCRIAVAGLEGSRAVEPSAVGRWPANLVFSHSEDCKLAGTSMVRGDQREGGHGTRPGGFAATGADPGSPAPNGPLYGDEEVEVWECVDGCAVKLLDEQSGILTSGAILAHHHARGHSRIGTFNIHARTGRAFGGDSGGASRFYFVAKPSRREREAGCEQLPPKLKDAVYGDGMNSATKVRTEGQAEYGVDRGAVGNTHPTIKSLTLMRWLVRLITPPGVFELLRPNLRTPGILLDCFLGSGTTGCAAVLEGFDFVGVDNNPDYVAIAEARIAYWAGTKGGV